MSSTRRGARKSWAPIRSAGRSLRNGCPNARQQHRDHDRPRPPRAAAGHGHVRLGAGGELCDDDHRPGPVCVEAAGTLGPPIHRHRPRGSAANGREIVRGGAYTLRCARPQTPRTWPSFAEPMSFGTLAAPADTANLALVRRTYELWNTGGAEPLVEEIWQPDVVFYETPEMPDTGVYRGVEAVAGRMRDLVEAAGHFQITVCSLECCGDYVLAACVLSARGAISGLRLTRRIFHVRRSSRSTAV